MSSAPPLDVDTSGRLDGRVALVTGAARGMGASHARLLAERGASVVLVDLDSEVEKTAADLAERGHPVRAVAADVTGAGAAEELVRVTVDTFGGLDILVHNAGLAHDWRRLEETTAEDLERYLAVNVTAPYALSRAAAPILRASVHGRIIFVSSQWGQVPDGHSYGYMVSKAGQLGLMKALADELIGDRVLVNAIAPGAVRTRMVPDDVYDLEVAAVPLGRLGEPDEVAAVVAFLASDAAGFITGQTIPVNGGALRVGI
ncbi:3-oxoacyl-[acyl-carrier protein] reductase [Mumia flava]|uniref:3-oxoacyl-[acyl-carrier protein] reductase n=1 Tax=Mumia flava TaxID=1348852 RepID=A0A0B2B629_9ACTN|nr:3-oxoacyl-[acyl-carrier protein] reductase [Mumia flava]